MAILHRADLHPTKLELLDAWLPARAWYRGPDAPALKRVVSYRFDDPAGEVGVETILVQAGEGPLYQVPLTYRAAPLDGCDEWLVGTAAHSVLGKRWVYDGCRDYVYADVLATAIFTGVGQAEEFLDVGGQLQRREPSMSVQGSGANGTGAARITALVRVDDSDLTLIVTEAVELTVKRILDGTANTGEQASDQLTGVWSGQPTPVMLASARPM